MSERRWFVLGDDGRPAGPLTTTEIIRALLDERVVSDAKLCAEGTTEWREAHAIEEFRIAAKAVRATVRRRLASDPRSDDVCVPHDEEDIPTRYFTPGAGAARMAARADTDDEEDVATRYFTPGAGAARMAARADTDDKEDEVETRYFQQPSAAHARAESMTHAAPPVDSPACRKRPPAPVVTGPPSGTRPSASVRSVVSGAEDDEDEVKTAYFQQPSRAPQPARSPLPPRAPALHPPPGPPVPHAVPEPHVTPHPVVASEAQPPTLQPVSLTAPVPVGAQQPQQVLPTTAIGPYARAVAVPPVRTRDSSWTLVVAGLTAFLVALLLASGVAWLMLRQ